MFKSTSFYCGLITFLDPHPDLEGRRPNVFQSISLMLNYFKIMTRATQGTPTRVNIKKC